MQNATLEFPPLRLPAPVQRLRNEVRDFIRSEVGRGTFDPDLPTEDFFNRALLRSVSPQADLFLKGELS